MSSKPDSVVIDTNVWISYIINNQLQLLTTLILDNELLTYGCDNLHNELADVLARRKFQKYLDRPVAEYVSLQRMLTIWVETTPVYTAAPDPKANFLFDPAIQAGADCLVTGDRKLLDMEKVNTVDIISPAHFNELLKRST